MSLKQAIWDLECSNLKANFGVIICAGIKPVGEEPIVLYKGRKGSNDRELVKDTVALLEDFDVLIGYYSLGFDLKFLNTRLMKYKMAPLEPKFHIDLYRVIKKWAALHSRRLEAVCRHLGIVGKTALDPDVWMKAALDMDKKSIANIVDHCYQDTILTEKLYNYDNMTQFFNRSIQVY